MLDLIKRVLVDSHENDVDQYINVDGMKSPVSTYLEEKRERALQYLGDKYILKTKVKRKAYNDHPSQL